MGTLRLWSPLEFTFYFKFFEKQKQKIQHA